MGGEGDGVYLAPNFPNRSIPHLHARLIVDDVVRQGAGDGVAVVVGNFGRDRNIDDLLLLGILEEIEILNVVTITISDEQMSFVRALATE